MDRQTGEAWIENLSTTSILFDAYQINSAGGHLNPTTWRSFQDFITADITAAVAVLGTPGWGEFLANEDAFVEGNLPGVTTASPGFKISIGTIADTVVVGDLEFLFNDATLPAAERVQTGLLNFIGDSLHPWQNPDNVFDVDGSGMLTVGDALALINEINSPPGPRVLPVPPEGGAGPPPYLDVNGDDALTVIDALDLVNELNRLIGSAGAAAVPEPSAVLLALAGLGAIAAARLSARRRR